MPQKKTNTPFSDLLKAQWRVCPFTVSAVAVAVTVLAAALFSWRAATLVAFLSAVIGLACWLDTRLNTEAEKRRELLTPYLTELPALIGHLRETSRQLEESVLQACDGFDRIRSHAYKRGHFDREMLRVIVALQFEDIVNQRIVHATETLARLGCDLTACLKPEAMSVSLESSVNFEKVHQDIPGEPVFKNRNGSSAPEANVELFVPEVGS
jgi:hypothetical protein